MSEIEKYYNGEIHVDFEEDKPLLTKEEAEEYYNKLWLENKELIQENIDKLNKKRFALEMELIDKDKEIERLNKELQDTKEHLGEYLYEQEEENKRLIKELKIKTDFIEELLYLILNSTDNKLQKEVHKIGIKYDKNIQKLKGSE